MPNLHEYMTIKDAAEYLGVTPNTLRNWGLVGKIKEYRHPINNYRLYKPRDLEQVLARVESPKRQKLSRPRPR